MTTLTPGELVAVTYLSAVRRAAEVSRRQAARIAGLPAHLLYRLERGSAGLDPNTATSLLRAYDITNGRDIEAVTRLLRTPDHDENMQPDSGPGSRERLAACERASHAIHIRPHPVGAVIARGERWVLILPADSGEGMHWPWPVGYRDTGLLSVPPLSAGPSDALHWARLGNGQGRVFSAPLPLYAALPLLVLPGPRPAPDRLDRDRTPVPDPLHPATA